MAKLTVDKAEQQNQKPEDRGKQGDQNRPYCPIHVCLMKSYKSGEAATHYRCPVKGCKETAKQARPHQTPPANPLSCPLCEDKFCEASANKSKTVTIRMVCPECGWDIDIPRPGVRMAGKPEEDLAQR